jgi:hypothetical protein
MATTTVCCFLTSEAQSRMLAARLRRYGLYDEYQETVYGERIYIAIQTRNLQERDIVRSILADAGIVEFVYRDESAA